MSRQLAISVVNVSKSYRLWGRRSQFQTLKSALLKRQLVPTPENSVPALQNVSFNIGRGEAFGVIGRNGSGKSTLLKIISGILKPSDGVVSVNGRVSALIELGAGFHPEISGRENVYINGIMLGLTRREIDRRFDQIVAFSGVGDYIDQPVKTYSSGMYVRLGFSVAVHVDPDILLIDEVLAVGDEEFTQQCIARIQEMKARGVTLLFVTHQLDLVRQLCDRAVWIDHGVVEGLGDPVRVCDAYLQRISGTTVAAVPVEEEAPGPEEDDDDDEVSRQDEEERWGSGEVIIPRVSLLDSKGRELVALGGSSSVIIEIDFDTRDPQSDFVFGVAIFHADGTCVYGTNTEVEGWKSVRIEGKGRVRFIMPSLDLVAGNYRIDAAIHSRNGRAYDYRRGVIRFVVGSRVHDSGIYRPRHEWEFAGAVELEKVDTLGHNLPAGIAESMKDLPPDAPNRRPRKRKS
jgi:ABC-type polysaccharide/polyol phosphate transport system ATPase subunit